jgi:UDP-GlcNAc3NAcA epimerase
MPEEINRILSDHVADLLFAPTVASCDNLHREGVPDSRVRLVGDVMYDATLQYGLVAEARSTVLEQLQLIGKDYILATLHRAENTENSVRLRIIIAALIRIAEELPVILPLHPRTRKYLEELGLLQQALQHLRLVDPVGYLDMLMLEKNARLITTDSGGVQKEAFFHRVQCLTLRDQTEWVELVDMGWNRLVSPTSVGAVVEGFASALQASPGLEDTPYGDGHAGERIAQLLLGANPKPIKIPTTHLTVQIPPSLNS